MNITASEIEAQFNQQPDEDIYKIADDMFEAEARSVSDALSLMRMARLFFEASSLVKKSKRKHSKKLHRMGDSFLHRAQLTLEGIERIEVEAQLAKEVGAIN